MTTFSRKREKEVANDLARLLPSPAFFAREKVPAAKRWADEGVRPHERALPSGVRHGSIG